MSNIVNILPSDYDYGVRKNFKYYKYMDNATGLLFVPDMTNKVFPHFDKSPEWGAIPFNHTTQEAAMWNYVFSMEIAEEVANCGGKILEICSSTNETSSSKIEIYLGYNDAKGMLIQVGGRAYIEDGQPIVDYAPREFYTAVGVGEAQNQQPYQWNLYTFYVGSDGHIKIYRDNTTIAEFNKYAPPTDPTGYIDPRFERCPILDRIKFGSFAPDNIDDPTMVDKCTKTFCGRIRNFRILYDFPESPLINIYSTLYTAKNLWILNVGGIGETYDSTISLCARLILPLFDNSSTYGMWPTFSWDEVNKQQHPISWESMLNYFQTLTWGRINNPPFCTIYEDENTLVGLKGTTVPFLNYKIGDTDLDYIKNVICTVDDTNIATVDAINANGEYSFDFDLLNIGSTIARIVVTDSRDMNSTEAIINIIVKPQATAITLNPQTVSLHPRESSKLTWTVEPSDAYVEAVQLTSDNPSLVRVFQDGLISSSADVNASGTVNITATTLESNKTSTCVVTVEGIDIQPTKILMPGYMKVNTDKTDYSIKLLLYPLYTKHNNITWTCDSNIITLSPNNLNCGIHLNATSGIAVITATTENGLTATCNVEIVPSCDVDGITMNQPSMTMTVGASSKLTAYVHPANATNKNVTWTTSNASIATVDINGNVTAIATGSATITCTTADGSYTATCTISVVAPNIQATSWTVTPSAVTLTIGNTTSVTLTFTPSTATNKTYYFTIDNPDVVSCTGPSIRALKEGQAVITYHSNDGSNLSATINVTVAGGTKITNLSLNVDEKYVHKNATLTLYTTILPTTSTNQKIDWTTSDRTIATVDQTGVVTCYGKEGYAIITATTTDGTNISAKTLIKVIDLKALLLVREYYSPYEPYNELDYNISYLKNDDYKFELSGDTAKKDDNFLLGIIAGMNS